MEQIRDEAGKVIGGVTYVGRDDVWKAESIHQQKPQTFHDPDRARAWIRQLHDDETGASES